jgi:hypothetical protein
MGRRPAITTRTPISRRGKNWLQPFEGVKKEQGAPGIDLGEDTVQVGAAEGAQQPFRRRRDNAAIQQEHGAPFLFRYPLERPQEAALADADRPGDVEYDRLDRI